MSDNEPISSITHLIGTVLSIAGLTLMVVFASLNAGSRYIISYSIFGASMILLYLASTLYHFFPKNTRIKKTFMKIDHSMIFVLIAGTYTPICLVAIRGAWGWSLFGIIWSLAIMGILMKSIGSITRTWHSSAIYIVMGWLIMVAFVPLMKSIPPEGLFWLIAGGISYTIGVIFFSLDKFIRRNKWIGMHEIFHLFVMAGTFCHFWLMLKLVLLRN